MTRYLIHWFTTCSGGLCDRILGLAASICIADMLNMKILIKWDHSDLSSGFKINKEFNWYENQCGFTKVILNNFEYREYFKDENIIEKWGNDNILMWSNMNLFYYALQNPHLKHIIPSNYIEKMSEAINCILDKVFIINKNNIDTNINNNIDNYLHLFDYDKDMLINMTILHWFGLTDYSKNNIHKCISSYYYGIYLYHLYYEKK